MGILQPIKLEEDFESCVIIEEEMEEKKKRKEEEERNAGLAAFKKLLDQFPK